MRTRIKTKFHIQKGNWLLVAMSKLFKAFHESFHRNEVGAYVAYLWLATRHIVEGRKAGRGKKDALGIGGVGLIKAFVTEPDSVEIFVQL